MQGNLCILGIDPGLSGAIAFYFPSHPNLISVFDAPVAGNEIDAAQLADKIVQMKPDAAIIEQVGSMPGQGVSSTFKFGQAFGSVLGILGAMQVPAYRVTPGKWKRHYALSVDKEDARALAIRMWPSCENFRRKKDHGRAEAALIARYFAETNKAWPASQSVISGEQSQCL